MLESENAEAIIVITVAVVLLSLVALVGVWAFGKLFRSKYSPFKFVNRMLDVETPVRIATPLSPDATERRLKDRVSRFGVPFVMSRRLVGRVSARDIRVRLHRPFVSNSFAPVFAGSISTENGETVIRGTYRLHKYVLYFMKVWFGFLIIWSTIGIPAGLIALIAGQPEGAMFVVVPFLMFCFGTAFVKFGAYFGDKDFNLISEALTEAVGGRIASSD